MSDQSTSEVRFASRLNPRDLDPALITTVQGLPKGDASEHVLGTIIGYVRGLSFRNNPNDPENASIGLLGVFEGVPATAGRPIIQAPMCFLPKSVHDLLVEFVGEAIERPSKMPERGKPQNHRIDTEVPIIVEVGVKRHDSPIGYAFFCNVKNGALQATDALADLRGAMKNSAALPAPQRPTKALPAPKPAAKRKK